ncbi:minichromosome maintenance protein MCM [Haloarcula laminariae]|uniref:minichromosome maintenance protein MCM n=1 Tax=Haloarcula laminariae TaxID=2961577 RepID=UPI0024065C55|nr:minichromosome maintenance protein MCM [Halomicroarcula sp. FL173]
MSIAQQEQHALAEDFEQFLHDYYRDEVGELAGKYPRDQESLWVSWRDLHRFRPEVVDDLRTNPSFVRGALETALGNYDVPVSVDLTGAHVRIHDVPDTETLTVGEFSPSDRRGDWVAIEGQVAKRTEVKPDPNELAFECQRCGTLTRIPQHSDEDTQEPHECKGCERQGPFRTNYDESSFTDFQWVQLEQPPDEAQAAGDASVEAVLRDDLVKSVESGDRVTLMGQLTMTEDNGGYDVFLDAEAADIHDTDFKDIEVDEDAKAKLEALENPIATARDSLAVRTHGYEEIKEAIILQLVSGCRVEFPDGSARRGNVHVLALGDPGTSKSRLLNSAAEVAPRSVYTSGKGASKAGMTASAVQDNFGDAEWTLEPGALVVANNGLACVDEIDKIPDDVVSSMHDALSTEQVHVNKAGINTTLQSRTAVLAAGNPKYGRFDKYTALNEQVELGPTILSRFDLIFQIRDNVDEDRDDAIAGHILDTQHAAKRAMVDDETLTDDDREQVEPALDREEMQQYIAYARAFTPLFETEDVKRMLQDEHVRLRQVNGDDEDATVPITHRKLEGAYRLAEASAKARFSAYIQEQDVKRALRLIGRSLQDWGQNEDGELDADVTESSTSATQRDRLEILGEVLKEMQIQYDDGVPVGELIANVTDEANCSAKATESDIEKLKRKGEIVEPKTDHLRSV